MYQITEGMAIDITAKAILIIAFRLCILQLVRIKGTRLLSSSL